MTADLKRLAEAAQRAKEDWSGEDILNLCKRLEETERERDELRAAAPAPVEKIPCKVLPCTHPSIEAASLRCLYCGKFVRESAAGTQAILDALEKP